MQYEKDIVPVIELKYDNFTTVEKTIADFFLQNHKKMDFSAKHISEILYTSEASLSRFAKKCGFQGYRQFIFRYRESLTETADKVVEDGTKLILDTYQELLNKSYALINEEQIKRVFKLIAEKRRIFLYGRGSSGVAAEEWKLRFMRLGIDIEAVTDDHVMTMNSAIVRTDSLVIGISVSGKTKEIIHSIRTAKSQGATTMIISSSHHREWDAFCDEILPIPTKENLDLGKLISPQFPILVLGDILYANVLQYDRRGKEALHDLTLVELSALAPAVKIL